MKRSRVPFDCVKSESTPPPMPCLYRLKGKVGSGRATVGTATCFCCEVGVLLAVRFWPSLLDGGNVAARWAQLTQTTEIGLRRKRRIAQILFGRPIVESNLGRWVNICQKMMYFCSLGEKMAIRVHQYDTRTSTTMHEMKIEQRTPPRQRRLTSQLPSKARRGLNKKKKQTGAEVRERNTNELSKKALEVGRDEKKYKVSAMINFFFLPHEAFRAATSRASSAFNSARRCSASSTLDGGRYT